MLVFDLDRATVDEHTAHLLWNLSTDNTDLERFPNLTGWNSLYLTEAGEVTGTIRADLENQVVGGRIIENWECAGDCVNSSGGPSWTTTRQTGFTAAFEAELIPDGPRWAIEGSALIDYAAVVTAEENPTLCNGQECYTCLGRLCEIGEQMSATVLVEGWLEGDTISLSFVDRLEPDASQMDFESLRTTQFFMSRWSITMTGSVPQPVQEEELAEPEPEPEVAGERSDETPAVASPGVVEPEAADEDATPPSAASDEPAEPATAAGGATTDKGGGLSATGLFLAILLIGLLLFGVGYVWKMLWQGSIRGSGPDIVISDPDEAASADTHPPQDPQASAEVSAFPRPLEEMGATPPIHTLVATDGSQWVSSQLRWKDGTFQERKYKTGSQVQVIQELGEAVQVRVGDDGPVWIAKANLRTRT